MDIRKRTIIKKFALYGFFKNLKFFEPFLYIFFLHIGLSFLQIGTLISVREITKNLFEIPSGILADNYGRKKTMQICFVFYIFSFLIFFVTGNFYVSLIAMVFFGLGEAFRSGTHKAIIFTYLDYHNETDKKVEVYGYTKSYSLIGSAISAIIGALIVFIQSNYRFLFLFSVLPYVIDFILISSYPDYVNGKITDDISFRMIFASIKKSVSRFKNIVNLQKGLINSTIYDGYFKSLKDYLQAVLKSQISLIPTLYFIKDVEKKISVLLGITYFLINICSSFTTKNAFHLKKLTPGKVNILNWSFLTTIALITLISVFTRFKISLFIIILYLFYYVIRNIRRTFMLDYISDLMEKEERATMLSLEAQLETIVIILLSPILGVIVDLWGLEIMFAFAAISMLILYLFSLVQEEVRSNL